LKSWKALVERSQNLLKEEMEHKSLKWGRRVSVLKLNNYVIAPLPMIVRRLLKPSLFFTRNVKNILDDKNNLKAQKEEKREKTLI
jgi:hypothetical protein